MRGNHDDSDTVSDLHKNQESVSSSAVSRADAVLDTDVLVAGIRSRQGASWTILDLLRQSEIRLHVTVPLALEYEDVLPRHRDAAGGSKRETLAFLGLLIERA